jgi:ammonium transporter, Amt family
MPGAEQLLDVAVDVADACRDLSQSDSQLHPRLLRTRHRKTKHDRNDQGTVAKRRLRSVLHRTDRHGRSCSVPTPTNGGAKVRRLTKVGLLTGMLLLVSAPAYAQEEGLTLESLELNALIIYLMLATVLVFIMHAGFAMLEAGMTRQKNAANIVGKNLMTITLGIITYYAVGWGVMYGSQVGNFIGTDMFFLVGGSYEPDAILEIDFAFQAMFAATAATIVSGAVAERMKFGAYLAVAVVMTALIYPVVGAWTWGGGWIDQLGFVDFAGSTIVHLTGGVAALVGAVVLGARIGKFDAKTGKARAIPGHSMPLAGLGVLFLFFGWFGFNGGSVLELDGEMIAFVLVTTALAASGGAVSAALLTRLKNGKYDVAMIGNGILAGLVGITAGADVVDFFPALLVGLVAGLLVTGSVMFFDSIRDRRPGGCDLGARHLRHPRHALGGAVPRRRRPVQRWRCLAARHPGDLHRRRGRLGRCHLRDPVRCAQGHGPAACRPRVGARGPRPPRARCARLPGAGLRRRYAHQRHGGTAGQPPGGRRTGGVGTFSERGTRPACGPASFLLARLRCRWAPDRVTTTNVESRWTSSRSTWPGSCCARPDLRKPGLTCEDVAYTIVVALRRYVPISGLLRTRCGLVADWPGQLWPSTVILRAGPHGS